ncbi:unnamed protein product [Brassica oleracea]
MERRREQIQSRRISTGPVPTHTFSTVSAALITTIHQHTPPCCLEGHSFRLVTLHTILVM